MSSNGSRALRVYLSPYRFSNENSFNIFMTKLNYLNVQLIYNPLSPVTVETHSPQAAEAKGNAKCPHCGRM